LLKALFFAAVIRIEKEPNPRSSTFSPRETASFKVLIILSIQAEVSLRESPVDLLTALIKEFLFII
jgi:hypothetical protein